MYLIKDGEIEIVEISAWPTQRGEVIVSSKDDDGNHYLAMTSVEAKRLATALNDAAEASTL